MDEIAEFFGAITGLIAEFLGAVFFHFCLGAVLGLLFVGVVKWIFRVANPKAWVIAGLVGAAIPILIAPFAQKTPLDVLSGSVGGLLAAVWLYRRYSKAGKK